MTTTVVANEAAGRYEIRVDGTLAGFTQFHVNGDVATFPHTEIEPEFEGKGLASQLIRAALDDVRARGLTVVPKCPFVRSYIEKHPEYQDLVAR
jgi:predicted GNAT family acetyltransferase